MLSLLIKVFRKKQAEEHSENGAVSVVPLGCTMQANRRGIHKTQAHTRNEMASLSEVVLQLIGFHFCLDQHVKAGLV